VASLLAPRRGCLQLVAWLALQLPLALRAWLLLLVLQLLLEPQQRELLLLLLLLQVERRLS